jgi:hypothetical protein
LTSVPRQAFGFLALSNFKDIVQAVVKQGQNNPVFAGIAQKLDLASVIGSLSGEIALEVGPSSGAPAGGALLVGTDDPAGMERFLNRVATQIANSESGAPSISQTEEYRGVTIHSLTSSINDSGGLEPAYAVAKGFGIVATSPEDVKAVIDAQEGGTNIAGSSVFQDARDQVPAGSQLLYVDAQALLQRFGPQLSQSIGGSFSSLVEPNLQPIKALILSSTQKGDAVNTRLFLLIR